MQTNQEQTEGLICHVLPFQEHDAILTVFTEKEGMVKFFLKRAFVRKEWRGAISPLTRAEFIFSRGKGELLPCRDISIMNLHFKLRGNLACLKSALEMIQTLRSAFFAPQPTPLIYRLCLCYLEGLPLVSDPYILLSSLRLKILHHEGIYLSDDQDVFTEEESLIIEYLTLNRSLSAFSSLNLPADLHQKISEFFQSRIQEIYY